MNFSGSPEYNTETTEGDIGVTKSTSALLATAQQHLTAFLSAPDLLDPSNTKQLALFRTCVEPFQEVPQLIDSKLEHFVSQLASAYTSPNLHLAGALYTLCTVRGSKIIGRLLPSEVQKLLPVLGLIDDNSQWEEKYIVLLWLSTVAKAPFPLSTISPTLADDLYNLAWSSLNSPGKERDSAARLLGVLLTRSDMAEKLSFFYESSMDAFGDAQGFLQFGILQTLPHLIKFKTAEELKWYAMDHQKLLDVVSVWVSQSNSLDGNLHRLLVKNRSRLCQLLLSLATDEVPIEVEENVGFFLTQMAHPNTLVRYTCSKALARICQRLPLDLIDEVVDAVFREVEGESLANADADKWHGALLAIAEIVRRNLLNREFLPRLCNILSTAIPFEQRQLTYAIGSHVRDASCYVCWSLFRTVPWLDKDLLNPVIGLLVKVSCFDREVNNRRAASAAVQEFVGRQGPPVGMTTQDGLDVLSRLDYFRLGSRARSYTAVSVDMQNLGFEGLSAYLVTHCVCSWDPAIRQLAAEALGALNTTSQRKNEVAEVLAKLKLNDIDARHGVMIALAAIEPDTEPLAALSKQCLEYVTMSNFQRGDETFTALGFITLLSAVSKLRGAVTVQDCVDDLEKLTAAMAIDESDMKMAITACVGNMQLLNPNDIISIWTQKLYETGMTTYAGALGALLTSEVVDQNKHGERDAIELCLSHVIRATAVPHLADCGTKAACINALTTTPTFNCSLVVCCLDDYTVESMRGDVGSWVRDAALTAIRRYPDLPWTDHVARIVRISVESLDALRALAYDTLSVLDVVEGECPRGPAYFTKMLSLYKSSNDDVRDALVSGLTSLAGAERANADILNDSFSALSQFLVGSPQLVSDYVTRMLEFTNKTNVKKALASLRLLAKLFDLGVIDKDMDATPPTGRPLMREIFVKTYNMHINTASYDRLQCCIRVFGGIALECLGTEQGKEVVTRLANLLGHPSSAARITAAETLGEIFSALDMEDGELDKLVLDTPWRDLDKKMAKSKVDDVKMMVLVW